MMTPEEMRIAIAEACGWKRLTAYSGGAIWAGRWVAGQSSPVETASDIPDYLNDLNAMHEAEKVLTNEQRRYYITQLVAVHPLQYDPLELAAQGRPDYMHVYLLASATALQRAEAFCRVFWPERFNE